VKVVNKNYEVHDVNIMRPSEWGNPFSHLGYGTGLNRVKTREEAIARYAELFYSEEYRDRRRRLLQFPNEARLGCVCRPKPCHVEIIAGYYNWRHMGLDPFEAIRPEHNIHKPNLTLIND